MEHGAVRQRLSPREALILLVLSLWGQGLGATEAAAQVCSDKPCPLMTTCAEAYYFFKVCGRVRRDADNDGIPCENVCGKTKSEMIARLQAEPWSGFNFAAIAAGMTTPVAPAASAGDRASPRPEEQSLLIVSDGFRCGAKRTCREMSSCAEARFHLEQCGLQRLDGDGDGIPCNSLCGPREKK